MEDGPACAMCEEEKCVSTEAKKKLVETETKMKAESEQLAKEIMNLTARQGAPSSVWRTLTATRSR